MKVICIIPARYNSSRFEGKPLADIYGKPMIWWVYNQCIKVDRFDEVYVATDDERIASICKENNMDYVMTANDHPDHISRVHEVSNKVNSDYYICVNGDEPLISPTIIEAALPNEVIDTEYFGGVMRELTDPAETIDSANIKLAVTSKNRCVYMSRAPIPYPKGTLLYKYKKYVGVECFNKRALDFFASTPIGDLEKSEDIDHLRFIENGIPLYFKMVDSDSISVDTPKDLEKVLQIVGNRIENGEIIV